MRGKHAAAKDVGQPTGITPADAGKTFVNSFISLTLWDHPRGCGENHYPRVWAVLMGGSPPRMRGKLYNFAVVSYCGRITPADAGKTCFRTLLNTLTKDHPRGCGENSIRRSRSFALPGSPPRMRGKHSPPSRQRISVGITPADAGKTIDKDGVIVIGQDHPRGCGENPAQLRHCLLHQGSPPRMRGKPGRYTPAMPAPRITPADAGKTRGCEIWRRRCGDHPRGCGENCVHT